MKLDKDFLTQKYEVVHKANCLASGLLDRLMARG